MYNELLFSFTTNVNSENLSLTSSKSGFSVPTFIPIITILPQFSRSWTSTVNRMISHFTSKLKKNNMLNSVVYFTRAHDVGTRFLGDLTKTRGVSS